jgi:hypothetical protein
MPDQPTQPPLQPRGIAQLSTPPQPTQQPMPQPPQPPQQRQKRVTTPTPTSRPYRHSPCLRKPQGTETVVSGHDYTHICDPFWPCSSTFCCGCSSFVPLDSVVWTDTGETIAAYRKRLRAQTPRFVGLWRMGLGFFLGAALGAIACKLMFRGDDLKELAGFLLVLYVAVGDAFTYIAGTLILNKFYSIEYRREL